MADLRLAKLMRGDLPAKEMHALVHQYAYHVRPIGDEMIGIEIEFQALVDFLNRIRATWYVESSTFGYDLLTFVVLGKKIQRDLGQPTRAKEIPNWVLDDLKREADAQTT